MVQYRAVIRTATICRIAEYTAQILNSEKLYGISCEYFDEN